MASWRRRGGGRKQLGKEGRSEGHRRFHFGAKLPRVPLGAFIDQLARSGQAGLANHGTAGRYFWSRRVQRRRFINSIINWRHARGSMHTVNDPPGEGCGSAATAPVLSPQHHHKKKPSMLQGMKQKKKKGGGKVEACLKINK